MISCNLLRRGVLQLSQACVVRSLSFRARVAPRQYCVRGMRSIAKHTMEGSQVSPAAMQEQHLFIGGEFTKPHPGTKTFDTYNPSTGGVLTKLADCDEADVDRAVKAAYAAFKGWSGLKPSRRADYLDKLADLVAANVKQLTEMESLDCGKPLREATDDMAQVEEVLRTNGRYAREFENEQEEPLDITGQPYECKLRHESFGVIAMITPWNYPLLMAVQKIAAALAAGCTCILKPSEYASLTCIEFCRLAQEVQLPVGVFNLVTGLGPSTGASLVSHPLVSKVSFTGSIETGKRIMKNAADMVKPVHLELGGKSPMLVFDDVNPDAAVDWIMTGIFSNAGQVCSATSRVMIQENVYSKICDLLKTATTKLRVGPFNASPAPEVGPVISQQQYRKVLDYITIGKEEGLKVLSGGNVQLPEGTSGGYFVQPTIYADVPTESKLWKEEIFGPVLCIRSFVNEEDALKDANCSSYGLAAAVMTQDKSRVKRVSEELEAGVVWHNCSQPVFPQLPFGGYKQSGIGKECGKDGFKEFLRSKAIVSCDGHFYCNTFHNRQ